MRKVVVYYHANCPDGFGAAWCFWRKFKDNAEYIPVKHGDLPEDVTDCYVYVVDFSFPEEILLEMKERAKRVIVLDHHISAQKKLSHLSFCHFDMSHSGAYLAWAYLFGSDEVPTLIRYIEDRDLWKWEYPDSKIILSAIDTYEKTFEKWEEIHNLLNSIDGYNGLRSDGLAILRYKNMLIQKMC